MAFSMEYIGAKGLISTQTRGNLKTITLNRPKQLNALSLRMILELLNIYESIEHDESVKLVILKGNGKAFCAGGDLAAGVNMVNYGCWEFAAKFYEKQLTMDYVISKLKKPQVSILHGVVMGGGAGLAVHGHFRIATETTVFAMPETMIGLFPDVGASYFLSRLSGYLGEYYGLTGARLNGREMCACGLATHFVPSMRLPRLEEELSKIDVVDPAIVSTTIDKFSEQINISKESAYLRSRMGIINKCFSKETVEEMIRALEQEDANVTDQWCSKTIKLLRKASPTSLKIALRSIREGRKQSIEQCLRREYRTVCHVWRGDISKDVYEGCRALLLDKDNKPQWEPSNLETVDDARVELYFDKMNDKEWKELELPPRSIIISKM